MTAHISPGHSNLLPTEENMNDLADEMLGIVLPDGAGARLITRALELWGQVTPSSPQAAAPLLWILLNHLGSQSPVGQPIRSYLGIGQYERLTPQEIEAASSWADSVGLADTTRPVRDVDVVAAAICALADQLVPHEKAPLLMRGPDLERLCQRRHTRAQMLALAAKLKDDPGCDLESATLSQREPVAQADQPPQPPSTDKLFSELDQLLDGIDRCSDHPEGGWWETVDGARVGRIKLRELKELITRHLSPPQP